MTLIVAALLLLQFGPRAPLTPAETLLESATLKSIREAAAGPGDSFVLGSDAAADVWLTCREGQCDTAARAARRLNALVASKAIPQPIRSIRVVSAVTQGTAIRATAAIHVADIQGRALQVIRSLWSHADLVDEVVEVLARQNGMAVETLSFENVGQLPLEPFGIPTTTIVASPSVSNDHAVFVAAAAAYFLATLPNAGSEALLSHLMVGAHERLAEDGRKAVALMGSQQRASGEVLTMFANAIEREQRRIRSFERFMPTPVDPIVHGRIVDMEKTITGVWSSMGITPSPFVAPAERIRGRGGEDRRVASRAGSGPLPKVELPTAFLKFENVDLVVYELGNFIDGRRSISDIRDAVSSEFSPIALPVVVEYFERLAKAGAISIR
jgi:uncharacterized protein YcgI (DUF1989 family)